MSDSVQAGVGKQESLRALLIKENLYLVVLRHLVAIYTLHRSFSEDAVGYPVAGRVRGGDTPRPPF